MKISKVESGLGKEQVFGKSKSFGYPEHPGEIRTDIAPGGGSQVQKVFA